MTLLYSPPGVGRSKLDRVAAISTWGKESTHQTLKEVSKEAGVKHSDLIEAATEVMRDDPAIRQLLQHRARLIANANKKHPEVIRERTNNLSGMGMSNHLSAGDRSGARPDAIHHDIHRGAVQVRALPEDNHRSEGSSLSRTDGDRPYDAATDTRSRPEGECSRREDQVRAVVSGHRPRHSEAAPGASPSPNCWVALAPALTARVSEKNFETWLSSIRLVSTYDQVIVLGVPNTFFQEYLTEHYTEVIKEELIKTGDHRIPLFQVLERPAEASTEAPPAPTAEPPKDPELTRLEAEAADFQRLDPKGTNEVTKAKLAVILSQIHKRRRTIERRAAQQKRSPAWETDGGYTKGDVQEASRLLNKGKKPRDKDYS